MTRLQAMLAAQLEELAHPEIVRAAMGVRERIGGAAILFYGSALRTHDLAGVLDFYILHDGRAGRLLWPDVSYHEIDIGGRTRTLRAKVAAMPLSTFERAARGATADTTIWTRFAQPARLLWAADAATADRVKKAVADCVMTASRFAAALGPGEASAADYWKALFRETYGAEFRVEKAGRGDSILAAAPDYYAAALPLGWAALGMAHERRDGLLRPVLGAWQRRHWQAQWRWRKWMGRPLNWARLVKAAWTFDGAARYALWKIERHTGIHIPLTPWRERHPVLAAPGVLFRVWRMAQR